MSIFCTQKGKWKPRKVGSRIDFIILLGCLSSSKAYRVVNESTNTIVESTNVWFDDGEKEKALQDVLNELEHAFELKNENQASNKTKENLA